MANGRLSISHFRMPCCHGSIAIRDNNFER
jgi:hypothetical protein